MNRLGISKKEQMLLVSLLFLVLALPVVIFLAKQRQEIRPRARVAGGPARLFLSAPSLSNLTVNPGQSFSVDLYLDRGNRNVSAVQAYLSYPTDLLDVESVIIDTANFPNVLTNTFTNGNIDMAAGIAIPTATPTNTVQ